MTPARLQALLDGGQITVEGREYIGLAADGVRVNIGNVGDEAAVERYLTANPTPDTW